MNRKIISVLALLAWTIEVSAGLAFDDNKRVVARNDGRPQKVGGKICSAVEIALDKTGKAIEKAGKKTDQGLGIAVNKTSQALEKAGKQIHGWFDGKPNASK